MNVILHKYFTLYAIYKQLLRPQKKQNNQHGVAIYSLKPPIYIIYQVQTHKNVALHEK